MFGTHNVGRAKRLLDEARRTPMQWSKCSTRPSTTTEAFPSAQLIRPELAYAAWVTIQVGCDNSCAFCIVPAVRGKEQSRPFGELVAEVRELASARDDRGDAARTERELVRARSDDRDEGDSEGSRLEAALAGPSWASDRSRPRLVHCSPTC